MRHYIALIAWLAVAACSPSSVAATPSPSPSPSVNRPPTNVAQVVAGGCGATKVYMGGEPAWLNAAGAGNNPIFLPYALTYPPTAAGFIFGYPLRAGAPVDRANKILWVVGVPRDGSPLRVTGHPQDATSPTIDQTFPADSGPGEIYPSIVDVPTPGCWHLDLSWGRNKTSVDLVYS